MRTALRRRLAAATLVVPAAIAASFRPAPPAGPVAAAVPDAAVVTSATFDRTPTPAELGVSGQVPDASYAERGGIPAPGQFERARQQSLAVLAATARVNPALAAQQWEMVGPTNIGGRILDIVVDPDLPDTIYALAASGGVWRSTDGGKVFEPRWPAKLTQAMGAMTVGPDGTLWVGTGEAGPGGGSSTYGGNGVYKSTDKGATWEHVGLETSNRVGRIVVHPTEPGTVFVAATGNLYTPGGERGLYKTTDAGATWTQVLAPLNDKTGAVDVAIDPNNHDNVLVAMWENFRQPDRRYYTGLGSGIYRSTDGGETFAAAGAPFLAPQSNAGQGRIGIAYAPNTPDKVYAYTSTELGAFAGFYTSVDGGTTFTGVGAGIPLVTGSFVYGWWFGRIYVDPKDDNHIFATGVNMAETKNGGLNWGSPGAELHADQHAMAWDPKVDDLVYVGNDGGVYRSEDNGTNYEFGTYQPWSQLYSVDVDEKNADHLVAGLQDNGVNRSWGPNGEGPGEWDNYVGGDGEAAVIDPANGDILYGCSQYGACSVSFDGGETTQSFGDIVCAPLAGCVRSNWFTPVVLDPYETNVVYTGTTVLYRSEDSGRNFEQLAPAPAGPADFSNGPGTEPNPLFRHYGTISAIAVTDRDRGIIMVGTDDGNVWRSTDAGESFSKLSSPAFIPKGNVSRIAIDLENAQNMYVTFSTYRSGDQTAHVVGSSDGGDTWTDISSNLPDAPLNDILVVGENLVVASDVGVFISYDKGGSWQAIGDNLPVVPVTDIRYHAKTNRIYAGTFGRSAWATAYPGEPVAPPAPRPNPPTPPRAGGPTTTPATGGSMTLALVALVLGTSGAGLALRRRRLAG